MSKCSLHKNKNKQALLETGIVQESQAIIIPTKENVQIFHPEENKDQTTLDLH